jgi:Domain of unknown function (DUF4185)
MSPLPQPPVPTRIQMANVRPGTSATGDGGGLPRVEGLCSAAIEGDADGVFFVAGLETLALVHDPDLPPGSGRAWETQQTVDGAGPIDIGLGEALSITARFVCPTLPAKDTYTAAVVAVLAGQTNPVLQIPITATVMPEHVTISVTQAPATFHPGQTETFGFAFDSSFATDISGFFRLDSPKPPFTSLDPDPPFPTVPAQGSVNVTLPVVCAPDAAAGFYTLTFSYQQIGGPTVWDTTSSQVQVVIPSPPQPDPRKDHFNAVYVPGSTQRICQLTGGGDPEGKPHPNDTTRFGLLGTDLGSSFDQFVNGEHRTYFFFGDTHTNEGDQDGDAIAYTTDDQPEPEGLHLQFIMGDNQWRRLVIPGISLGNFEVPTGGFSHAGRIYVFATTGILRTGGWVYMENSVLASTTDAHNNFDLAYYVSHRDDNVDTPATGGKFINVAPFVINNDDWPGLPGNAPPGGQGLLMAGTGAYRKSAPYLAYAPLPDGQTPALGDWSYLQGFEFWVPGFGPSGPPNWGNVEEQAIPLFDEPIGEISYCFNAGLKRWLIVYGGCAAEGCGIVLRSAPMPWGPWSDPQLIFNSVRENAQGKYMFECGPYGAYVISRYDRWDGASQQATFYYTLSNGSCIDDNSEPRYQVHLMKSTLQLVNIG